jgi:hypothetical protein
MEERDTIKKIFVAAIFTLFAAGAFGQAITVLEHSNSFEEITVQYQTIAKEIAERYNYVVSALETTYAPVLNDENKKIAGNDKFVILWNPGGGVLDINLLWLCNTEAKQAIFFNFREEYLDDHIPCTPLNMSRLLVHYIVRVYSDPKWYVKPDETQR